MESIEALTRFFGWCAVINISFLILATFFVTFMRGLAVNLHTKMFALSEEDILRAYFQYLAQYLRFSSGNLADAAGQTWPGRNTIGVMLFS